MLADKNSLFLPLSHWPYLINDTAYSAVIVSSTEHTKESSSRVRRSADIIS